jgi:hypothetical protein
MNHHIITTLVSRRHSFWNMGFAFYAHEDVPEIPALRRLNSKSAAATLLH